MFCCDLRPVIALSPEGEKLNNWLKYLAIGYLVLSVVSLIGGTFAINGGLMNLFLALIAYMSFKTHSYRQLSFFVWLAIINLVYLFVVTGDYIQHWSSISPKNGPNRTIVEFAITFVFFGFNSFALYVAYLSYKEFKALAIMPGLAGDRVCNLRRSWSQLCVVLSTLLCAELVSVASVNSVMAD